MGAILLLLLAVAVPAVADDVGITSARLIELAVGSYALEADVAPQMVAALRDPVLPDRFSLADRPGYRRVGVGLVVRYEFGGSDRGLEAGDVLLLPWARSAVLLTTRWQDGSVHRAMFPHTAAGIRVPIEVLRPVERSPASVARRHFGFEFRHAKPMLVRGLLVLALLAAAGTGRRAVRLALIFAAGQASAMVALDLGAPTIATGLASALLGLGVAVISRSALRGDHTTLWPLVLLLGVLDGLGIAGRLALSGLGPGEIVPSLFGAALGCGAVMIPVVGLLAGAGIALRPLAARRVLATAAGSLGMAAAIAMTVTGFRSADALIIDPADRMAAARFELRSGTAASGTTPAGLTAAAPRRLDDPAMVFLTVEPAEVRIEVLLSLRDFLQPLRIAGGPESVVPVDVQDAIAERARRMVAQTIGVVIDGREAVPILERTDFVTVAATGVTTRREPEPEPLATSVLGITLAYGVERPPSEISLAWRVFPDSEITIPTVWTDPTGSERIELTVDSPRLQWANDLSSYATPPVRAVEVEPPRWPLASIALAVIAAVLWFPSRRKPRLRPVMWAAVTAAIALYPFARTEAALPGIAGWAPARAETAEIVDGLLINIYRAFDLRDEEAIYDRLEVSVTGDKLSEIYLENRRALELENRGGARARVDEVEVLEVRSVRRDGQGGYRVETVWTVSGSVNHFGHVHYRQNRYDAALHLFVVDGAWKIRKVEILEERRVL